MNTQFIYSRILGLLVLLVFISCGTKGLMQHKPQLSGYDSTRPKVERISPERFIYQDNFLLKNPQGLWEMYVQGDPLQIGLRTGALQDSLFKKQEQVFFGRVQEMIPSQGKQKWLSAMLKWYNRDIYQHISDSLKTEIYGLSRYANPEYNSVATPYLRVLYLHGAHDIGHALQDLMLVGCSSFAVWGNASHDGKLLLGRNFDFYAGDEFSKDKLISFVKPDQGYAFASVGWAGMIGVVSGMNTQGLTVTINAGRSAIPLKAKTPISLVTRMILQYASNLEEAVAIAKKHEVFVSESILVGSAKDQKALLIEMSPKKFDVFEASSAEQIICSNHFQSEAYKDDKRNRKAIQESHSAYRWAKMNEEITAYGQLNPLKAVEILRNTQAMKDSLPLGYGNEKALNQLLAHHGVVFAPTELKMWVSANPYQLGEFVCYDLKSIFQERLEQPNISLAQTDSNIAADPFLNTREYVNYEEFRKIDRQMSNLLEQNVVLPDGYVERYQSLNPDFWKVYYKAGLYFYAQKDYERAQNEFTRALQKEITTLPDRKSVEKYLKKTQKKLR